MDKQAREAREQMKALPFREKWDNFWYYYKKHVVIGVIAVLIGIFTFVQCANRIDYDLTVSYYSSIPSGEDGILMLEEMMCEEAEDINNNESVDVNIPAFFSKTDSTDEYSQAVQTKFSTEMMAGESMGYILDEVYKEKALKQYPEFGDAILEISSIPEINEMLGVVEGKKLYWITKTLYEFEKNREEKILEHENAKKIEKMFIEMGAEIISR